MNKKTTEDLIPEIWQKEPIFMAVRQNEPREISVGDDTIWRIGTTPPVGQVLPCYLRAFDVRHAEVIFALFSYFRDEGLPFDAEVNLSYTQLLKIVGWSDVNQQETLIKDILGDLENIWVEITSENYYEQFRILSTSGKGNPQDPSAKVIERIIFNPTFIKILENLESNLSIRFDVFKSIPSKIAKAIYLYLPSKAMNCTKEKPFRISLTDLFAEIGIPNEENKANYMREVMDFL